MRLESIGYTLDIDAFTGMRAFREIGARNAESRTMNYDNTIQKTQAERYYGRFMADTIAHSLPIGAGTSRGFLAENAAEITETAGRFRNGSELQRTDESLPRVEAKPRAPRRQIGMD